MEQASQVPEGTKIKDRCWWTGCSRNAYIKDWTGYKWCPYHAYYTLRWGGGDVWFGFKNMKLHWPKTRIVTYKDSVTTQKHD